MKKRLRDIQAYYAKRFWKSYKDTLTAEDGAEIFGISVQKFYRITKVASQTKNKKDETN